MDDLQGAAVFFFWARSGWFWAEMGRKHEKFLGLPSIFGKSGWEIALRPLGFLAASIRVLAELKEHALAFWQNWVGVSAGIPRVSSSCP